MSKELFLDALKEYGVREIPGAKDNEIILSYFRLLGFDTSKFKDETAWCSAFVNYICKINGYEYSGKLNARSWLKVGTQTYRPELGDVVVLWRESIDSWKGHVGFFVKETKKYIYILGGNQGNQVCIKAYPKERLIHYRKLLKNK